MAAIGDAEARAKWDAVKARIEDVHRHHRKDLYALGEQALPALTDPTLPAKHGYDDWPKLLEAELKDGPGDQVQRAVLLVRLGSSSNRCTTPCGRSGRGLGWAAA